jgi:hypothetical protein
VDHPLHRVIDLVLGGVGDLRVVGADGPVRQPLEALADDPDGLDHLLGADEEPGEGVALGAHGDVEVEVVVDEVRLEAADVVGDPAGAEVRAGEPVLDGLLGRDHADVHVALVPDPVAVEDAAPLGEVRSKLSQKSAIMRRTSG